MKPPTIIRPDCKVEKITIEEGEGGMSQSNLRPEMFRKTPRGERYKLLWRMIKRYYFAFKSINKGSPDLPFLSKFDIAQSFFIFCYHLKDWLIADSNINKKDIEELFSRTELRYCADLCNGFKHLRRKGNLRSKSQPDYEKKTVYVVKNGIHIPGCKFIISTDQGDMDAFTLASRCLDILYEFIRKYDSTISKELEK